LPNNGVFDVSEWTFSGIDALDGETSNASASTPYPLNSFTTLPAVINYTWYSDPGLSTIIGTGNTYTPTINSVGTETVYVTAAIGACESDETTVTVTINALPNVDAGSPQTVCEGELITLSGAGALTYDWDHGVSDGVAFNAPSSNTTYTVIGTDANGCENSDQVTININALPVVSYTDISEICTYDNPVTLAQGTPSGGTHSGNGVSAGVFDPDAAGLGTQVITYSYTDGNGCSNSANWTITVDDCAGITDPDIHNVVSAYPNPTSGVITILGPSMDNVSITLTELNGKVLETRTFNGNMTMDLPHLSKGTYLLRINETQQVLRIVLN
jgi:hypothetical protein